MNHWVSRLAVAAVIAAGAAPLHATPRIDPAELGSNLAEGTLVWERVQK